MYYVVGTWIDGEQLFITNYWFNGEKQYHDIGYLKDAAVVERELAEELSKRFNMTIYRYHLETHY
jgi:hypothetical protein